MPQQPGLYRGGPMCSGAAVTGPMSGTAGCAGITSSDVHWWHLVATQGGRLHKALSADSLCLLVMYVCLPMGSCVTPSVSCLRMCPAGPTDGSSLAMQHMPCPLAPELSSGSLSRGWANSTASASPYLQVQRQGLSGVHVLVVQEGGHAVRGSRIGKPVEEPAVTSTDL